MENKLQKFKNESGMILAKMAKISKLSIQTLSAIMSKTPEGILKLKISTLVTIYESFGVNLIDDKYELIKSKS